MASTAVPLDAQSRVLGYQITKGVFNETTANLPQRIVILAEANTANQSNVLPAVGNDLISESATGLEYGFGSPAHQIMRILRSKFGDVIGSTPTLVYSQLEAGGAVAAIRTITVTGAATATAIHNIYINGRSNVDGSSYTISIVSGDSVTQVATKISDAVNAVLGSPVIATSALGVVTLTAKWKGVTSDEVNASVDTLSLPVGLSYAVASPTAGSGIADITASLTALDSNEWNTIVINSFSSGSHLNQLEVFNGRPDASTPTGRYAAIKFKPIIALFGSKSSEIIEIAATTDTAARKIESTNVLCPAPLSSGFSWEAAANVANLLAPKWTSLPHTDVSGELYPDMPTPVSIGDFATWAGRDALLKKGSSTVDLVSGKYQVQEIVTTYHPVGETPASYQYVRNLNIDWNIAYGINLIENRFILDHMIANDDANVNVDKVIKPKQIKQLISSYANDLESRGLIVEKEFMKASIVVNTGDTNPDRVEISFKYKRSPYGRVISTTVEAGFAFGLTA